MLYHRQYSSALQWLNVYENVRRNLNLKRMTVWTDEADPRSDLLKKVKHQVIQMFSSNSNKIDDENK